MNTWKNNVGKSKLEVRNEIVLELKPLINNECLLTSISTSSTAQGSGGSFKNRKPIGGVGCCDSRMAERSH